MRRTFRGRAHEIRRSLTAGVRFSGTLGDTLALGALYALIALGYTLVSGVLRFINVAHADVFTFGA
jgi:branched-subunit amino acid ABC-type transport system permease component